ncbi:hypothetical protein [Hydrogenophaga sp.]|uniref:hypothetical protein n=1 Tax=Hydrogenophaga sp. TaxID=1904254 RepID=UPI00260E40C8|nr:hypothetical protein [Hydrogenophaga sp.]MCW5652698.1 hypothetical protein [Hydrogenophaga sp.]
MPDIHCYNKTPQAWEALARPDLLGRQAHTLVLMANGRRGVHELSLLLGEDVSGLARTLQQQGYLYDTTTASASVAVDDDALSDA